MPSPHRKSMEAISREDLEALARYSKLELNMMTLPKLRGLATGLIRRNNLLSKDKLIDAIWSACSEERARLGITPPDVFPVLLPEIIMSNAELCPRSLQENLVLGVASSIQRLYASAAKTGSWKVEGEANRAALGLLSILKTYEKNLIETEELDNLTIEELQAQSTPSDLVMLNDYLDRLKGG